ncbi:RNA-binding Raly-like protein isoform X2 [Acanthochromis polyacanthus]|uniref:RNA-binding Raly-like protein isoform X2 n=1 Tax=Acanthochromis polyacanthus TaxID=80966 RepID=UPI00223499EF|nr:RNA-binding Raly-like protein isoform X2 [Acanthochromis polyacanthus]
MIHLRSTCHRDRHTKMNGELRAGRTTTGKRGSSDHDRSDCDMEYTGYPGEHYNRVFDYQRVPSSVPVDSIHVKRPRPSSSSSSSSSTAALRAKNSRVTNRSNKTHNSMSGSSNVKLKMAELLAIKSELTVIKVQIDGLLDCVDKMDRQRKDCSECPQSRESSVLNSPHQGSVCSMERESPEPGEASADESLHYQDYYPHSYSHRLQHHTAGESLLSPNSERQFTQIKHYHSREDNL